ncbi:acetoin:2,6-dichlorophenolindophenol oxidoreductase subunit beta [Thermoclostridium stercorarium subsp. stercorarium DSM 8532]|jgi:2-oxoisovalerate dehydrogenase E1 component|uniref:Acetoin:2,6-dichlorophenolindophenol oxidoreductase subunit beta n=3 Tax=Thermoclostridium stercorarium TaxID=1510 RepID=L7VMI7_THES1|nr:alpha-ketoacid dehydrogenase subunit alpha/beta [Thermoclostridium stercorarium]AGC67864.1 acetoin:2,6-dichlorophenolindophenol oxidoreductase subunit beta [Thermoclostridium stercorarium subsp. stercorarium DSM 8532]AGI38905.1 PdhE [Thermoclostridium stercorarium subsp. stercorarium DSM 8532]ANW98276.1 dehydrogenase [Thermoclostridium stercorarium subsp. thermolacticum DSM 2910]ANX00800.1 dehydrogenase [Thermoclostridium stercorarium subsp. leptospartum DSM 9219]UZQ86415.1 thiamine pyropho
MPKSQFIDPAEMRKPGKITFRDIPVNQYNKTIEEEKENFTTEDFLRIYRDMAIIREFETMMNEIKTKGEYNGIQYNHPGPAHLSIGQEAAAVGQAYLLDVDDYIFGSHRSHGEILAKGLSAIQKLPDEELMKIMKNFRNGLILKIVEKHSAAESVKELAIDFLVYGAMAEIFARETGFQAGLGGSMHAFFTPFGIYPNNAIVGGSADIAVGAALYKKVNRKKGIVIANIGDGAMGCGPVWEALCLAAMDQYKKLWEGEYKGGLPFILNVFNNHYGMGGQTRGETMGFDMLARIGAGVNPEQMHAERVDGYNPLAIIDAIRRKKKILLEDKDGPVLLDTVTYRYSGHSPSDASSYRTKEEIEAWMAQDPLITFRKQLVEANVAPDETFDEIWDYSRKLITRILKLATDDSVSPRMDLRKDPDAIGRLMFSNQRVEKMEDRKCEVLIPKEENPQWKRVQQKERFGLDKDGKPVSKNRVLQLRDALFEALIDKFYTDPTLIAYGEENRDWGGAFAVYRGLTESLPYHRLFNSPISEGAIVGSAVGYALSGGRVVVELMYADFMGRAGDEIFNQLAKWQAMSAGQLKMPVVLRISVGSKYGAQHSQDWSSLISHIPGLKCVFPATPYDAKGLLNSALSGTDPVIFFESQRIYDVGELFHKEGVPRDYYEIPIGEPDIKKEGKDITILTIGATLYRAMEAAKILEEKYGLSAEIIDARSIVPFNYEKVIESVKKTGRILLTSDACERGSFLKEMAQTITELAFDYLDAPPVVVGSRNWITPAHELEEFFFPQPEWMIDAIHEKILPLPGHVPSTNFTKQEMLRLKRLGI